MARSVFILAVAIALACSVEASAGQQPTAVPEELTREATGSPCGDIERPCAVASGEYYVAVPGTPPGPEGYPVLIHLHGWSSSGKSVLKNKRLAEQIIARGYVLIAPNGLVSPRGKRDWSVRDQSIRPRRDELAFLQAVLADIEQRLKLDPARILLTGFSRGGSMVWDIACQNPQAFAAYAPIAGGFWSPLPETCTGPVRLFHTHGWADGTVPLEGRTLGTSSMVQGDIFAGLGIWRTVNGCAFPVPAKRFSEGESWTRNWTACSPGTDLRLTLHPGAHVIPPGWAEAAIDWFETQTVTTTVDLNARP